MLKNCPLCGMPLSLRLGSCGGCDEKYFKTECARCGAIEVGDGRSLCGVYAEGLSPRPLTNEERRGLRFLFKKERVGHEDS